MAQSEKQLPDPSTPTTEAYDHLADLAEAKITAADDLVREANTLHRMCEVLKPGGFYKVVVETDFKSKW
jgi:hypothetical protein